MHALKIKICGITRLEDGLAALEAGADMLGFIRAPASPRWRDAAACADLVMELRLTAQREFQAVGVYVNAAAAAIEKEMLQIGFDRIQLHGREDAAFARSIEVPVIKAIRIADAGSLAQADDFPGFDLLADAAHPTLDGGTGESWDYALLADLAKRRRVLLAGGLTPDNIAAAVQAVRPWGVDVSSGVETGPGEKDHDAIRAFITNARSV